jgi:hypothetical protein
MWRSKRKLGYLLKIWKKVARRRILLFNLLGKQSRRNRKSRRTTLKSFQSKKINQVRFSNKMLKYCQSLSRSINVLMRKTTPYTSLSSSRFLIVYQRLRFCLSQLLSRQSSQSQTPLRSVNGTLRRNLRGWKRLSWVRWRTCSPKEKPSNSKFPVITPLPWKKKMTLFGWARNAMLKCSLHQKNIFSRPIWGCSTVPKTKGSLARYKILSIQTLRHFKNN